MSEQFDPYHKWLGIPLHDQPPTHYRLLGIEAFESDPQVIEIAADRQMKHVRTFRGPQDVLHSQRLLNELAAARVCLLNPEKKEEYDLALRSLLFDSDVETTDVVLPIVLNRDHLIFGGVAAFLVLFLVGGLLAALLLPNGKSNTIVERPPETPDSIPETDPPEEKVETDTPEEPVAVAKKPRPKKKKPPVSKETKVATNPPVKPPPTTPVTPEAVIPAVPKTPKPIADAPPLEESEELLKQFQPENHKGPFAWLVGSDEAVDFKSFHAGELAQYLLTMDVERVTGTEPLLVGLSFAGTQTIAVIGATGGEHGLDQVNGEAWDQNQTGEVVEGVLNLESRSLLRFLVESERVRIFSGDDKLIDWSGDMAELSIRPEWKAFDQVCLFVGSRSSKFRIRHLSLAPVVAPTSEPVSPPSRLARIPIPDKSEQEAGEQLLQQEFRSEILAARKPVQKIQLARKLFGRSLRLDQEPGFRYRAIMRSLLLATDGGSTADALDVLESLDQLFEIDFLNRKTDLISDLSKNARLPDVSRQVAQLALATMDEAVIRDRYEVVDNLGRVASSAARIAKDADLLANSQIRTRDSVRLGRLFAALQPAIETLKTNPEDPEANHAVGLFQCFEKEEWEHGLPYLSRGSDVELRELTLLDLENPEETSKQLELANAWWQLASNERGDHKAAMSHRAQHWFLRALPSLSGAAMVEVESRLRDISGFRPFPGCLLRFSFESVTFRPQGRETLVGDLSGIGHHGLVDSLRVLPGKVGNSLRLQRSNSLRVNGLFPANRQPRTIMFWVLCNDLPTDGSIHVLDCGTESCGFQIQDGVWQFQGGPEEPLVTPVMAESDDEWHHHAITYNGVTLCYFVDGKMIAEREMELSNSRTELVFGPAKGLRARFTGALDEFAVFNRALSPEEILDLVYLGLWNPNR